MARLLAGMTVHPSIMETLNRRFNVGQLPIVTKDGLVEHVHRGEAASGRETVGYAGDAGGSAGGRSSSTGGGRYSRSASRSTMKSLPWGDTSSRPRRQASDTSTFDENPLEVNDVAVASASTNADDKGSYSRIFQAKMTGRSKTSHAFSASGEPPRSSIDSYSSTTYSATTRIHRASPDAHDHAAIGGDNAAASSNSRDPHASSFGAGDSALERQHSLSRSPPPAATRESAAEEPSTPIPFLKGRLARPGSTKRQGSVSRVPHAQQQQQKVPEPQPQRQGPRDGGLSTTMRTSTRAEPPTETRRWKAGGVVPDTTQKFGIAVSRINRQPLEPEQGLEPETIELADPPKVRQPVSRQHSGGATPPAAATQTLTLQRSNTTMKSIQNSRNPIPLSDRDMGKTQAPGSPSSFVSGGGKRPTKQQQPHPGGQKQQPPLLQHNQKEQEAADALQMQGELSFLKTKGLARARSRRLARRDQEPASDGRSYSTPPDEIMPPAVSPARPIRRRGGGGREEGFDLPCLGSYISLSFAHHLPSALGQYLLRARLPFIAHILITMSSRCLAPVCFLTGQCSELAETQQDAATKEPEATDRRHVLADKGVSAPATSAIP